MGAMLTRDSGHEKVYWNLRKAIEEGTLQPGQTVVGTRSLARQLGVSHYAIDRGMSRLTREGWLTRRVGSGTFVRLTRPPSLSANSTGRAIGLVTNSPQSVIDPFLRPMREAIRGTLEGTGFAIVERHENEAAPDSLLAELGAQGVVILMLNRLPGSVSLAEPKRVVLASHCCESVCLDDGSCDMVTADARHGGALAGRYLRDIGCRSAIFVGAKEGGEWEWDIHSFLRLKGFESGWGAPLPKQNLHRLRDHRFPLAVEYAQRLLPQLTRTTGVFCASDDIAMGLCHGAAAHGKTAGSSFKLIGFDNQPARYADEPRLTSVAVPLEAIGRAAARLAIARSENPQNPVQRIALSCSIAKGDTA